MRIIITGGGTGGHIYPALAVAEALKRDPALEDILYIGNQTSLESELVPKHGLAFESIVFHGMPRRPGPALIKWLCELKIAIDRAEGIIKRFNPHVVFGTGGYVSAPVLMAAQKRRIPYVIHEPDAHPGLVNRLMSRWADTVTAAFADSHKLLGGKSFHVTGNPLRGGIGNLSRAQCLEALDLPWEDDRKVLLALGGSQGARTINRAVVEALPVLLDELGLRVIHQTGTKLFDETMTQVPERFRDHPDYLVRPYYPEMAPVLGVANLALCRAGSLSLSEMYLAGIPTVLVPYPFAAADHQRKNALASVQAGASRMILDADCDATNVTSLLRELLSNPDPLGRMRAACKALARPNAAEEIVGYLKSYAN